MAGVATDDSPKTKKRDESELFYTSADEET